MDVCPGKAEPQDFVKWVPQHMVGHVNAEGGRERHLPGPVVTLTGFLPMQRYPDYSECLCEVSALSPSLLPTSSPTQAFSVQVLTKPWLRPVMAMASPPLAPPNFHHIPSQLLQPIASKHTLPRNPFVFSWVPGSSSWHRLGLTPWRLSALPGGPAH